MDRDFIIDFSTERLVSLAADKSLIEMPKIAGTTAGNDWHGRLLTDGGGQLQIIPSPLTISVASASP